MEKQIGHHPGVCCSIMSGAGTKKSNSEAVIVGCQPVEKQCTRQLPLHRVTTWVAM